MIFTGASKSIAILGGGLTGLTAAFRLTQLGNRVRVFEQGRRVGGAIRSEATEGWIVEAGPNSLQTTPEITDFIREIGLDQSCLEANPIAKNRYLVRDGRLVALPLSPREFLHTPLFSAGTKLRVLAEMLRPCSKSAADRSVAEFARRHFGRELLDHAIQPFVSGIHAGDAEKLSLRHAFPKLWEMEQSHGSVLRAQMAAAKARRAAGQPAAPAIVSFHRGLEGLPMALAAQLPTGSVALSARVERIVPGRPCQVVWHDGKATHTETFDAVISALPAAALARLAIGPEGTTPLASLAEITHPPVSSLFFGFKRNDVLHPLDGFGLLVPPAEKRTILGVLFSSSLFPGRAPAGHVALTVLVGGALQPELAGQPVTELTAAVMRDLRDLLGVVGYPVFSRHTFWPQAIPQYELGYERHLAAMAECERAHPGFFIGGQVRDGIALGSCIAAGEKLATTALRYVKPGCV